MNEKLIEKLYRCAGAFARNKGEYGEDFAAWLVIKTLESGKPIGSRFYLERRYVDYLRETLGRKGQWKALENAGELLPDVGYGAADAWREREDALDLQRETKVRFNLLKPKLSRTHTAILFYLLRGASQREIADRLEVTEAAISHQMARIEEIARTGIAESASVRRKPSPLSRSKRFYVPKGRDPRRIKKPYVWEVFKVICPHCNGSFVNNASLDVVARLRELKAQGLGLRRIAAQMRKEGILIKPDTVAVRLGKKKKRGEPCP